MSKYTANGEIYSVLAECEDNGYYDASLNWYEYRAYLCNEKGQIVDSFNSLFETYNGVQRLTKAEAQLALDDIVNDCNNGLASDWFSLAI